MAAKSPAEIKSIASRPGPPAREIEEMFARISRRYDRLNAVMTLGMHHRWKRLTARIAVGKDQGPALDVATGTGDLAVLLARLPGTTRVVGVDFCLAMLKLAEEKVRHRPPPRPVTFQLGDALRLGFRDASFICATSGFALRNVESMEGAIAEMCRVVKPGGRVVVLELTPMSSRSPFSFLLKLYFNRIVPLLGQLLAGDRAAYTYLPTSVTHFPTAGELAETFRKAGLIHVSYRKLNLGTVAIHWGSKPPGGNSGGLPS